ncbi:hypothetical protein [Xanthobacter aminoxidans]|uniref:hypothetical protein n=1 Tax=Xanthobacter aminoxidans TaxID=186280 RepID=UPI002022D139|nr:hypothetical protein [Xanthobacter aminoxidans]MCL8385508.1 hypothetical protein [Xanthobacter aminoxidans]
MARAKSTRAEQWRPHLTEEEAATLARAEAAKESWRLLKHQRALIISRASTRARRAGEAQPRKEA